MIEASGTRRMPPPKTPELATATEYPVNSCVSPSMVTVHCAGFHPASARSVPYT